MFWVVDIELHPLAVAHRHHDLALDDGEGLELRLHREPLRAERVLPGVATAASLRDRGVSCGGDERAGEDKVTEGAEAAHAIAPLVVRLSAMIVSVSQYA